MQWGPKFNNPKSIELFCHWKPKKSNLTNSLLEHYPEPKEIYKKPKIQILNWSSPWNFCTHIFCTGCLRVTCFSHPVLVDQNSATSTVQPPQITKTTTWRKLYFACDKLPETHVWLLLLNLSSFNQKDMVGLNTVERTTWSELVARPV